MMEAEVKSYYGHARTEDRPPMVTVRPKGQTKRVVFHHLRHSPDGFNWGYSGSGPSELARCILFDAFGVSECPSFPEPCDCTSPWVDAVYPAFRDDIIAKFTQDEDFRLDQVRIVDWVFDYVKGMREQLQEEPVPVG